MPTAADRHGTAHHVVISAGGMPVAVCELRVPFPMRTVLYTDVGTAPATCLLCIGEGPSQISEVFYTCLGCGQWWQELDEHVIETCSPAERTDLVAFTTLAPIRRCSKCP